MAIIKSGVLCKGIRHDNGEWIKGSYLGGSNISENYALICPKLTTIQKDDGTQICGDFMFVEPETVCCYTGRSDQYETGVFEGDKVEVARGYVKKTMIVFYDDDQAMFMFDEGDGCISTIANWVMICIGTMMRMLLLKKIISKKENKTGDILTR